MAFTNTSVPYDHPQFRPLPEASLAHMEKQRAFVVKFVSDHFASERITGTQKDFALLQKIVDSKTLKKTQTWELQSLGIIFGDALIRRIPGLHWMEVTDSYGTDPALLYKDTTIQLNPLTMLSKRIEDNKPVDIDDLVIAIEEYVQKEARVADKRK